MLLNCNILLCLLFINVNAVQEHNDWKPVPEGKYPFIVLVDGLKNCLGMILDSMYVLVPAHCVYDAYQQTPKNLIFNVTAGMAVIKKKPDINSPIQRRHVMGSYAHEEYAGGLIHDIAFLTVTVPFLLNNNYVKRGNLTTIHFPKKKEINDCTELAFLDRGSQKVLHERTTSIQYEKCSCIKDSIISRRIVCTPSKNQPECPNEIFGSGVLCTDKKLLHGFKILDYYGCKENQPIHIAHNCNLAVPSSSLFTYVGDQAPWIQYMKDSMDSNLRNHANSIHQYFIIPSIFIVLSFTKNCKSSGYISH